MYGNGDRVSYFRYTDDGSQEQVQCIVTSTFFEPGDPVQGLNLRADDGRIFGGVDSRDCFPGGY